MRILLVEDDVMIGESLQKALRQSYYTVDWAQDGESAEISLRAESYDLVILDQGLPDKSGPEVLKELRARKDNTPILILTARDAISDRVNGLDLGADDYMLKPFALEELEARIRSLLRRKTGQSSPVLSYAGLELDPLSHKLTYQGQSFTLSSKEFSIMHALMERPTAVLSRPQLESNLYGWNEEVSSNAVEVHIHQLRKKLGNNVIRNIRNVGYTIGIEK